MSFFHAFTLIIFFVLAAAIAGLWSLHTNQLQTISSDLTALKREYTLLTAKIPTNNASTTSPSSSSSGIATENLQAQIDKLSQDVTSISVAQNPSSPTTSTPTSSFQKQVLTLGSDTTTSTRWTTSNQSILIDSTDYPPSITIKFTAGLRAINGSAQARLINTTTGAIITTSEISHNTNQTTWVTSGPFKLHSGENTYSIQLRSTSSEQAHLAGARIILE